MLQITCFLQLAHIQCAHLVQQWEIPIFSRRIDWNLTNQEYKYSLIELFRTTWIYMDFLVTIRRWITKLCRLNDMPTVIFLIGKPFYHRRVLGKPITVRTVHVEEIFGMHYCLERLQHNFYFHQIKSGLFLARNVLLQHPIPSSLVWIHRKYICTNPY